MDILAAFNRIAKAALTSFTMVYERPRTRIRAPRTTGLITRNPGTMKPSDVRITAHSTWDLLDSSDACDCDLDDPRPATFSAHKRYIHFASNRCAVGRSPWTHCQDQQATSFDQTTARAQKGPSRP